jgi:hypothetical protein
LLVPYLSEKKYHWSQVNKHLTYFHTFIGSVLSLFSFREDLC